jgi:sigma-54 dependent transcriptional regulator, acetoin dehydrogenase operon transcriptional activator AcoR
VSTMHCSAAPIRDVHGALAGVLDISSEGVPFGFDAARVVSLYAGAIENHLLISQSDEHLVVRFQVSPELLDSALVALVGIDADGRIAWRNDMARSLLDAQGPRHMSAWPSETAAETEIPLLLNLPESGAGLLTLPNGLLVWARMEMRAPDGHRGLFSLAPSSCTERSAEESSSSLANAAPCGDSSNADSLPQSADPAPVGTGSPDEDDPAEQLETLKDRDLKVIERAIKRCGGNVSEAARLLGVSRGLIYRRLREARQGTPAASPQRQTPRGSAGN